jgi:hypothetical protein
VFALVKDGLIVSTGGLPTSARRLDTQAWVMGLATAGTSLQQACGYFMVVEPARPTITTAETFDPDTIDLVNGVPTRIYHVRSKTAAELAADLATATATTERDQARQAITALDAFITRGATNTAAQVRDMTVIQARILKRLIRDSFGD